MPQPGHFLRDCPEKNAVGDTGGKKPPPGYVCRACASELHLIQDCPVTTQTRREPQGRKGGPPKVIGRECAALLLITQAAKSCYSWRMLVLLIKSKPCVSSCSQLRVAASDLSVIHLGSILLSVLARSAMSL